MREIKFRAWDGEHMLDVKEIVFTKTGVSVRTGFNSKYRSGVCKNPVVMQFTGLRDKNGKEIYAGDIVQFAYIQTQKETENGVIEWYGDCWVVRSLKYKNLSPENYRPKYLADRCEVIGNIYENPELLAV